MSYQTVTDMHANAALFNRLTGCAAQEAVSGDPAAWVAEHIWVLISHTDWIDAWAYAEDTKTVNQNQDTGMRDDVINDAMILSAVQAAVSAG